MLLLLIISSRNYKLFQYFILPFRDFKFFSNNAIHTVLLLVLFVLLLPLTQIADNFNLSLLLNSQTKHT